MKYFDLETRKAAHVVQKKAWYTKNRELSLKRAKEWREANKERHQQLKKDWARRNRPKIYITQRASKYNLTTDELRAIYQGHNGLCDICGSKPSIKRQILNIDHDHKTGTVRGLLCTPCNLGVGWVEKFARNLTHFIAIIKYLGKTQL